MLSIRWLIMPYGMEQNPDGTWIVFNRNYKPLGILSSERVDYADEKFAIVVHGLTAVKRAKLDVNAGRHPKTNRIYFYNDGCVPDHSPANMKVYLARLKVLMSLEGCDGETARKMGYCPKCPA